MRIERGSAQLAVLYVNSRVKDHKFSLHDFMPHDPPPEMTLEQAMNEWV